MSFPSARVTGEKATAIGFGEAGLKNEDGATLVRPCASTVGTTAMGLGRMAPASSGQLSVVELHDILLGLPEGWLEPLLELLQQLYRFWHLARGAGVLATKVPVKLV